MSKCIELTRLWNWYRTVKAREAYQNTCQSDWNQYLLKLYTRFEKM